jgi:diguanylate cyclase (GGDEF)-like protein
MSTTLGSQLTTGAVTSWKLLGIIKLWPLVVFSRFCAIGLLLGSGYFEIPTEFSPAIIAFIGGIFLDGLMCVALLGTKLIRKPGLLSQALVMTSISISCGLFHFSITKLALNQSGSAAMFAFITQIGVLSVVLLTISREKPLLVAAGLVSFLAIALANQSVTIAMAIIFFGAVMFVINRHHVNQELQNTQKQAEQRHLVQRAQLLMTDYEESGRGWFWLTDRHGCLSYLSQRMQNSIATSGEPLLGKPLTSLVAPAKGEGNEAERTLSFHMSARTAFTDLVVKLADSNEDRWLSMSGVPFFNELGQFMGFRGHGTDLTEVRKSQDAVTHLARYDNLTGLANRLYIQEIFEKALVNHRNLPNPCAIFMLDLDRFKQVNDTLGHAAGDILLKQVSERLTRTIGEQGQVGRLGGDEFLVVLPGLTHEEKLSEIAKLVIANLSHPYMVEGNQIVIGASVGIVMAEGSVQLAAETLMRNGDLALYAAKDNGRGTYRFYNSNMHKLAKERGKLEEDLRNALATGGLTLAFQPVVHVASEEISGFEALARWEHPTIGTISPGQFIPIAEDAGLIMRLGEWVLRTACSTAASWPNPVRIAVNVSPTQFTDPGFPTLVINTLAQSGLAPERLELEITENVFIDGHGDIDKIFASLKAIGVRLALDDFGTGYSALGYLRKAPVDKIKIDQSFVRGAVRENDLNRAIIKSIVVLAEALNMETTAEGAETQDELELVRSLGCSHLQGFVYGKAMSGDEAAQMLTAQEGRAIAIGYEKSRSPRQRVMRMVGVIHDDYCYQAKIRNLSTGGALIEGLWDVPPMTHFVIVLSDRWKVRAVARWSNEDKMGVEFTETVSLERLKNAPRPKIIEGAIASSTDEQRMAS